MERFDLKLLWVDDEPDLIRDVSANIQTKFENFEVQLALSADEAIHALAGASFDGAIFDLKLGDLGTSEQDGSELLKRVNDRERSLPTYVFSGWLEEERFKQNLNNSYALRKEDKNGSLSSQLSPNGFFSFVNETASVYSACKGLYPEKIEFKDYISAPSNYQDVIASHWTKHGSWITKEMERRGLVWVVVVGYDIAAGSTSLFEFPDDEELVAIGEKQALMPFAYTADNVPELMDPPVWAATDRPEDYFPTLNVNLKHDLVGDFDTGAPVTHANSELSTNLIRSLKPRREGTHLARPYSSFVGKTNVGLYDNEGDIASTKLLVEFVTDWADSPFVSRNADRQVLVGRDLFLSLGSSVTLDGSKKSTSVSHKANESDPDE